LSEATNLLYKKNTQLDGLKLDTKAMEKITKDSKMEAEKYSVYRDEIKKGVSSLEEIKKNLKTDKSKLEARGNEKKIIQFEGGKIRKIGRGKENIIQ